MISVDEAKKIISGQVVELAPVQKRIEEAAGLVLARDLIAPYDIPAFPQSSMDGYAFSWQDFSFEGKLAVAGEMAAGSSIPLELNRGQAVRIFTGAAVPPGADTVVMQEKVKTEDNLLIIGDPQLRAGENVRAQGSEIRAGEIALLQNSELTPGAIGFLAGIGISSVSVYPTPVVTILVTGNELQQPGNTLQYGQVYESNSRTLAAVLYGLGAKQVIIQQVPDDPELLQKKLAAAVQQSDLVLLTGGVSVGDYDYVPRAASACGINQLFHKIRQRPGKPIWFGRKDNTLVFGLPGNPSSVLTCFYEYVIPAWEQFTHRKEIIRKFSAPLKEQYKKTPGLVHFLKGIYRENTVSALDAQESFRMSSFARANCLIRLEEEDSEVKAGAQVAIHLLP